MTRRRILLAILLAVTAVGVLLVWWRESVLSSLERRLAHSLIALAPVPLEIGRLEIGLWPPGIDLTEVAVHVDGETPVRAQRVSGRVALAASLWEGEWIIDLILERPEIAFAERRRWWESIPAESASDGEPASGKLRSVVVRDARATIVLDDPALEITVTELDAQGRWSGIFEGEFGFEVRAAGLLKSPTTSQVIEALDLAGAASAGGVRFDRARVIGAGSEIEFAGSIDPRRVDGELRAQLALGVIGELMPLSGIRGGAGKVRARIEGELPEPGIDAELIVDALRIGEIELSGGAPLRSHGLDWSLGPGKVRIFGGEVDATASGHLATGVPYVLRGKLKDWTAREFLKAIDAEVPLAGQLDGDAEISGKLFGKEVGGKGVFRLHREGRSLPGEIEFHVVEGGARLDGRIGDQAAGTLRAELSFGNPRNEGDIVVANLDLAAAAPFVDAPLGGRLDGKASFGGAPDDPHLGGVVAISDLTFDGVELGRVTGPFALHERGIESSGLDLADLSAHLDGHLPWTLGGDVGWNLRIDDGDLERLAAASRLFGAPSLPLDGRLDGSMTGSGPLDEPNLAVEWTARKIFVEAIEADALKGRFDGTTAVWKVSATASRERSGATAKLNLARAENGSLRGSASVDAWPLSGLQLPFSSTGTLAAEGTIAGTSTEPLVDSTFSVAELTVAGQQIGAVRGTADLRDGTVSGSLSVDAGFEASLRARDRWPHPFDIEARWSELAIRGEKLGAEDVVVRSSGEFELAGDLERLLRKGKGKISSLRLDHPAAHLESPAPWIVGVDDGALSVAGAELRGEGQRIVGEGRWSPEIARIRARGEGSLALAEGFVPGLVSARGLASVDLEAWRPAGERWRMKGEARVGDAAADFGVLVGLSRVHGEVDLDEDGFWVREFTGDLGGGQFAVEGRVDRTRGFALEWRVRRASLGVPVWLDHRVTGEGSVDGPVGQPIVHGSLRVEQAIYDRDIEWAEFVPWFRRETRGATMQGETPIGFDLRILADDGIFISNNLAAVELSADLRVGGTGTQPTLVGRIDVIEGNIDFRGRKFGLTSGTILFDESHLADPTLEILGEANVRTPEQEVAIDLRVSGRATEPRIEFVADDPSFTQNDVLALVTFGRTVSQLQTGGAGISLDEVLSLTAGQRADRLERGVHTLLPVDRIEIEPAYSRLTGSTEPKLRIGKDMTSSLRKTPLGEALRGPLQASAGSSLGAGREQDVTLEYGLTPTVAVLGSWQSDTESGAGAFGGDIKFRRQFWGLSGFSLLPETMPDGLLSPPEP